MTIDDALREAAGRLVMSPTARLDAEVLLAHVCETNRTWLYTWGDRELTATQHEAFQQLVAQRIEGLLAHYDFADDTSLAYFRKRLSEAPDDVAFGLDYVLSHADTRERQDAAAAALIFKTDVLWAQLDALWHGYVQGNIPPGAWQPGEGMA